MTGQVLFTQWRWNREVLAFFIVASFAMPLLLLWLTLPQLYLPSPQELVLTGRVIGWSCMIFALLAGGGVAAQGYGMDDRVGHIYSLALPVTRRRFLAMRTLTACVLLALPALAVWIGATLAAQQVSLPASLQSYAGSLALRALLAAWLAHAAMFTLRYSAGRRAKVVFLVLVVVSVSATLLAVADPTLRRVVVQIGDVLGSHPGPFGLVFDRWTLFDV
jgi:hypothetical protein